MRRVQKDTRSQLAKYWAMLAIYVNIGNTAKQIGARGSGHRAIKSAGALGIPGVELARTRSDGDEPHNGYMRWHYHQKTDSVAGVPHAGHEGLSDQIEQGGAKIVLWNVAITPRAHNDGGNHLPGHFARILVGNRRRLMLAEAVAGMTVFAPSPRYSRPECRAPPASRRAQILVRTSNPDSPVSARRTNLLPA